MTEHEHGALGSALAAMREGDRPRALKLLLQQWRQTPHPALSRIIQELGAALAPKRKALTSMRTHYRTQRWRKIHGAGRAEDMDLLLKMLPIFSGSDQRALVALLAERAPDPRMERFLLDGLSNPGWEPLLIALADLAELQDPEHRQELQSILHNDPRAGELARALQDCLGRYSPPVELPTGAEALLESLSAGSWTESSAKLFSQIYAAPEDDAPRAILADALQEAEDPRGEFIQLQLGPLTPDCEARQEELLQQHRSHWLGPFAPVVLGGHTKFRRGLVSAVTLGEVTIDQRRALTGRPEWATVESVTFSIYSGHAAKMIAHSPMRSLRTLHRAQPNKLLGPRMARLRELSLFMAHSNRLPDTPLLHHLSLLNSIPLNMITDWRGGALELRSIHLHAGPNSESEFVDWALHHAHLERVTLDLGWDAKLTLEGDELTLVRWGKDNYSLFRLRSALAGITSTKVHRVRLVGPTVVQLRAQLEKSFGSGVQIEEITSTS